MEPSEVVELVQRDTADAARRIRIDSLNMYNLTAFRLEAEWRGYHETFAAWYATYNAALSGMLARASSPLSDALEFAEKCATLQHGPKPVKPVRS